MAIDYASLLGNDQKKAILKERITQMATEAYQYEVNLKLELDDASKEALENNISVLEKAIEVHQKELDSLTE
jgi:hypothetical protein